jgi:3-oxoacyl-[acyl-carrier-protein] synthase III
MSAINISQIDINFPRYSYTIEEIVDELLVDKLDEEVKRFCKKELGINRVYKSYDLSKIKFDDAAYLMPDIRLNDMYIESASKILDSSKIKPDEIRLLTTINDNQQYVDPSPTVELVARLGLNKDIRTQNFQGMACSSFSEALLNTAGHFALGGKGKALVLIGTYYTNWFLDRIKQIKHISMKNRRDFNNFIYFVIFSDVVAAAILSQSKAEKIAQINTRTISSRKDTSIDGYKKATLNLAPDSSFRMVFDMDVNSKILRENVARLSAENVSYIRQRFPDEFNSVKFWGFHTAGKVFVDFVREQCDIKKNKSEMTYELMAETGNTGAVSSLQLINESVKRKILTDGDFGGIIDYGWEGADAFLYCI